MTSIHLFLRTFPMKPVTLIPLQNKNETWVFLIRGSVVLKKIKTQCSISSSTSLQNSHNHNYHPTLTRPKSLALYLSVPSRIKWQSECFSTAEGPVSPHHQPEGRQKPGYQRPLRYWPLTNTDICWVVWFTLGIALTSFAWLKTIFL